MSSLPCLFRTLGKLQPQQLVWRAAYRVLRPMEMQGWSRTENRYRKRIAGVTEAVDKVAVNANSLQPLQIEEMVEDLNNGRLTLLNLQNDFRGGPDWCMTGGRKNNRLWKYNLHYHGWMLVLSQGIAQRVQSSDCANLLASITQDWIDNCRIGTPGFSHYAWNSYTIASRLENWRLILGVLPETFWKDREELHRNLMQSLAFQASYLESHIEWDVQGNHLIRDAVGLASAGRMFAGPCAKRWMRKATEMAHQTVRRADARRWKPF